jgi:hypothetical protein
MLFYATLAIVAALFAALCVWVYRSASTSSRKRYQTLSASQRKRSNARLAHLNAGLGATPAPWGWAPATDAPTTTKPFADGKARNPRFEKSSRLYNDPPSQKLRRTELEQMLDGSRDQSQVRSVRNVLTGYDLQKKNSLNSSPRGTDAGGKIDTSQWPYRDDSYGSSLSTSAVPTFPGASKAKPDVKKGNSSSAERKPWGW